MSYTAICRRIFPGPDSEGSSLRQSLAFPEHPSWPIILCPTVQFGGGRPRTCFSRMCARASPSPGSWEAACTTPPYIAGSSPARIPRAALDSHPSWPIKEREEAGGGTRTRIYPRDCHLHHAGPFLPCLGGVPPPAADTPVKPSDASVSLSSPRSQTSSSRCTRSADRPPQ